MFRTVLFVAVVLTATAAHSESDTLFLDYSKGVVVDRSVGAQYPVIASMSGSRPENCPPDSFWTEELKPGAVIEECADGSRYEVRDYGAAGSVWGLWPKPLDEDDAGPRIEK